MRQISSFKKKKKIQPVEGAVQYVFNPPRDLTHRMYKIEPDIFYLEATLTGFCSVAKAE